MLEIKVSKDSAVVNTDNTNYTDVVADMAIMVMSAADYMTEALKESNNVVTIDYGEFILDVAKVVAVYAELETKKWKQTWRKTELKTVCICNGCKELLEYGPSMGFNPDIKVKIVDEKDCDYLIMSDGSFQFEHKERN